jgi:hypothetical protein
MQNMGQINEDEEIQLLRDCEKNANTEISGKQRFLTLLPLFSLLPQPKTILDVGGTLGTFTWLHHKFPRAKIIILNTSKKETSSLPNVVIGNAETFITKMKFDLIFAGEILEHLNNPDGFIASSLFALNKNGHLIITTPNLSCFYNRLFLLFGWTPGNYSASYRYITGNPVLSKNAKGYGVIGDHKSVFTYNGLRELLTLYGFNTFIQKGFSYSQTENLRTFGKKYYHVPGKKIRLFLNSFLPDYLKEGQIIICKRPEIINKKHAYEAIRKKSIWNT